MASNHHERQAWVSDSIPGLCMHALDYISIVEFYV